MKLDPSSFIAAVDQASRVNYLGDVKTVEGLLREFITGALNRRTVGPDYDQAKATESDVAAAELLALIFLGQSPDYPTVPAWNAPGGIDQYMADRLSIAEQDPVRRLQTGALLLLSDFYRVVNYSQQEGVRPSDWEWQVDALVEDWRNRLLGIPEEPLF